MHSNVFPHMIIESLSVFELLQYCEHEDYEGLEHYLLKGFNNLAAGGADFAALTGITPHIVFQQIAKKSPIPVVSMIQTTCEYASKKSYNKIGLLGTLPTMQGTFFQDPFKERGITVITPSPEEMVYINNKISNELEFGYINSETVDKFRKIAMRMIQAEKLDALVLGCTELPLIFDNIDVPVEKIDVMRIHIDALIHLILS